MSWEFSTGPVGPERGVPHAAAHAPFIDIKRLFQLRTPLMVGVFFLLAIPGLIAAWYLSPGKYTATAELRFLATTPRVMEVQRGGARDALRHLPAHADQRHHRKLDSRQGPGAPQRTQSGGPRPIGGAA